MQPEMLVLQPWFQFRTSSLSQKEPFKVEMEEGRKLQEVALEVRHLTPVLLLRGALDEALMLCLKPSSAAGDRVGVKFDAPKK